MSFSITAGNLTWINDNRDDPKGLCLHGHIGFLRDRDD